MRVSRANSSISGLTSAEALKVCSLTITDSFFMKRILLVMPLHGSFVDQICHFESFVIGKSRSRVGRSANSRELCPLAVVGDLQAAPEFEGLWRRRGVI